MDVLEASSAEADHIRKIIVVLDDISHVVLKLDFGLTRFPFLPVLVEFCLDFVE